MPSTIQKHTLKHDVDEHVFIMLECEGRPTISIDIANAHGRRAMSVRVDGMTMHSMLLDVDHLEPKGKVIKRFCPICGEEINLVSSKSHKCEVEYD